MLDTIARIINWSITIAFFGCFGYQAIYFFVRYFREPDGNRRKYAIPFAPKPFRANRFLLETKALDLIADDRERRLQYCLTGQEGRPHDFAVLIAARNEEAVIGNLIQSIQRQTYSDGAVDIFVVADNCTDRTAVVASGIGANVYVRHNKKKVGKGYALEYLLNQLKAEGKLEDYDGYFIFDADNILSETYIEEANRTFSAGYQVVTSYRNSSNFGRNWISYGYALWFLHEAQLLNKGRMYSKSSCMVSGTGYMISTEVIKKNDGWKFFLLTEDIEFTADCILNDIPIGYCEKAKFYDEQPTKLKDSWNQRLRWIKGYYQVAHKYSRQIAKKCVREKSLSCYDMLMVDMPAFIVTSAAAVSGLAMLIAGIATSQDLSFVLYSLASFFVKTFIAVFLLGAYTLLCEWDQIDVAPAKKILYLFTFPIFMYTYFPIAIAALKKNVEWKPIAHGQHQEEKDRPRQLNYI